MKLLIVTQKIDQNDDVLGFFHGWVREFAKNCEKVTVICLKKGEYDLPENVKVLSLGKEKISQKSKICKIKSKLLFVLNFYKYIWQERKNYDAVFVHMNQIYVILGGLIWKLLNKKIGLWYAHGHVSFSLRISEKLINVIFTSTKSGFRLKSNKIKVVGQGINIDYFKPLNKKPTNNIFKIITIGRISPIKDYETLINAAEILKKEELKFKINIIGGPATKEQEMYLQKIINLIKNKELENEISFAGPVPNKNILKYLQKADLFVNMSHTGSLDKAILEAMTCGLPILTCNEALNNILENIPHNLIYPKKNIEKLSLNIKNIFNLSEKDRISLGQSLRRIVIENHSLSQFIPKILNEYK